MENKKHIIDGNAIYAICRTTKIIDVFPHWEKMSNKEREVAIKLGMKFKEIIQNAPTVDVVEVVHGKWSTIEDDYCGLVALHCSVCNQEWWFEEDAPIKHYHYCPNCGAKMDGDGNE